MLKSIFIAGRETNYPRNELMISALRGVSQMTVIGSHKSNVFKGGIGSILRQSAASFFQILPRLLRNDYDFVFIGFFGQVLIKLITPFVRKPIILDLFVSAYDTMIEDRKPAAKGSLLAKLLFKLDQSSTRSASLILTDTTAQAEYFHEAFGTPLDKMKRVFVGCDERLFHPLPENPESQTVLYYCSYLPLHGVDVVLQAAQILQADPAIRFRIIGRGMEYESVQRSLREKGLTNVELAPPVLLEQLPAEIQAARVCLGGHFGASAKACRVIPGKVFQMIAMGKPVIVGDNAANKELLTHGADSWFCEMNDPAALAEAVRTLFYDSSLRSQISSGALETYQKAAASAALISEVQTSIKAVLNQYQ